MLKVGGFMQDCILGLDIGIASVGWAVVLKQTQEVLKSGVRLFSAAEASENQNRRTCRGIRRNKRRQQNRLKTVSIFLNRHDFFKPETISVSPLKARVAGLKQKLTQEELFVALYNLVKHRGVSYLEDIEEAKDNDQVLQNIQKTAYEYPCQIQLERFESLGYYRGTNIVDDQVYINTFTIGMYGKEARQILSVQKEYYPQITDQFIEEYLQILKTKREYYIGPGNEKSRTNYGVYKTNGETKDNLFDELRGKCSVYSGKYGMDIALRASGASYTVQYYNLLNDLCNIKYQGRKLSQEEKEAVIDLIKDNKIAMKITKALKRLYGFDESEVKGYRVDKNDKEENHSFEIYRMMRQEFEQKGIGIKKFSTQTLDAIADILTINTETQGILSYLQNKERPEYIYIKGLTEAEINILVEIRRKKGSLFSKWSNFSYRLLNQLMPEMMNSGDEQHTCINRMNIRKYDVEAQNKIDGAQIVDEIYNPVVSRSIMQTVKIINALMKKYSFCDIVIEMPRDRNSDEQRKNIQKMQKDNEARKKDALKFAGITEAQLDYRNDKNILKKLMLYYKQQGKCLYSGNDIDIELLLKGEKYYEIDHIIPISISFDDSQSNKVLVESGQNRKKGQKTPFAYLSSSEGNWSYKEYQLYVLDLFKLKYINKKQKEMLLFEEDITKIDVVQGFINRNINDTRYASKVVLNELQRFFANREISTKIKVINGSMTSQLRKNVLDYQKDRDLDYRHHAQDAMICCYTALSLNQYQKEFVNLDTGEIIDKERLYQLDKDEKARYLSLAGWDTKMQILKFNDKIKFSHKVDTKVNRTLSDQTIYGTREKDGAYYVVNKIKDIYDDKGYESFFKKLQKDPTIFLMYQHDSKTWDKLMKIIEMYPDVKGSPFKQYRKEFGSVTKYAKKDNGSVIKELKYLDHKMGKGIDITHKYENARNKVVLESLKPFRADLYYDEKRKVFHLIPIKYADFKFEKGRYILPIESYEEILRNESVLGEGETMGTLKEKHISFRFSLYKNSILELIGVDGSTIYRFLAKSHNAKNYFEVKGLDKAFKKQVYIGITKKIHTCNKYNVDILGNVHKVEKEPLILQFQLDNMMI